MENVDKNFTQLRYDNHDDNDDDDDDFDKMLSIISVTFAYLC